MDRPVKALLATICAVAVANVYYAQPLLGRLGAELSIPTGELGLVVGAGQVGYLLGLVVLLPLGDLVSRRALTVVLLAAAAAGTGLAGFSADRALLLIGLLVAGFFSVVVQVAVAYAAALSDPAERGRNIGVVTSGVVVGIILARTVSGAAADLAGWRAVYLGTAALSLALAALAFTRLPAETRTVAGPARTYVTALASVGVLTLANRVFRVRAVMTLFLFASFGVLWSGISLPLSGSPWHLSTSEIGLFGIAGLAGTLGAARAGAWSDRGHGGVVTAMALVALIGSWAATGQAPRSLVLLVLGVVLLDAAVQAVHVTSQNQIVATRPAASSRLIGSYMVFYSVGSALGAITATTLYATAGWAAVSTAGCLYAVAALAVWTIDRAVPARTTITRRPRV
ncbi:MFS transporter [Amycolatopsis saalfeldensis]|uniref:Predicted arabinose efflux permease, MFS family n=1 Tax=Amycolatopsis saalfeldensis TaxID=394193 RepID=A0A1H8RD53_9PSEU|nr:MFS transporter [Amycolatopsis saalfeldensis]SEO63923.1 Predicted arabinose efflux permease, MFS family [Amycolatopsis saalfeldensis]